MNINAINQFQNYKYNTLKNVETPKTEQKPEVAFKGKGEPGVVTRFFADTYGKWVANSKSLRKICEWIAKVDKKGNASNHFQVAGSFVTSSAYMMSTLRKKDFDKKNANTLAINQGLGFVVPTVAGYTVNAGMAKFNKDIEYNYSAIQERKLAKKILTAKEAEAAKKALSNRLKGFRTLISIVTFTTIYRYLAPVAITPVANKFGNWLNNKIEKRKQAKEQAEIKKNLAIA